MICPRHSLPMAQVLEVPISELLVESEDSLSQPLLQRAAVGAVDETALALLEQADCEPTRVMAQTTRRHFCLRTEHSRRWKRIKNERHN